jgi:hypothetical protein
MVQAGEAKLGDAPAAQSERPRDCRRDTAEREKRVSATPSGPRRCCFQRRGGKPHTAASRSSRHSPMPPLPRAQGWKAADRASRGIRHHQLTAMQRSRSRPQTRLWRLLADGRNAREYRALVPRQRLPVPSAPLTCTLCWRFETPANCRRTCCCQMRRGCWGPGSSARRASAGNEPTSPPQRCSRTVARAGSRQVPAHRTPGWLP